MQQKVDTGDLKVLKCVQDYKTGAKLLKIRAFALFHQCEYRCVEKPLKSDNVDSCAQKCQQDLDEYFELKRKKKLFKEVFYALPIYEKDSKKLYLIPEDQSQEYQKKTLIFEQNSQAKLTELREFLDQRAKQYKF